MSSPPPPRRHTQSRHHAPFERSPRSPFSLRELFLGRTGPGEPNQYVTTVTRTEERPSSSRRQSHGGFDSRTRGASTGRGLRRVDTDEPGRERRQYEQTSPRSPREQQGGEPRVSTRRRGSLQGPRPSGLFHRTVVERLTVRSPGKHSRRISDATRNIYANAQERRGNDQLSPRSPRERERERERSERARERERERERRARREREAGEQAEVAYAQAPQRRMSNAIDPDGRRHDRPDGREGRGIRRPEMPEPVPAPRHASRAPTDPRHVDYDERAPAGPPRYDGRERDRSRVPRPARRESVDEDPTRSRLRGQNDRISRSRPRGTEMATHERDDRSRPRDNGKGRAERSKSRRRSSFGRALGALGQTTLAALDYFKESEDKDLRGLAKGMQNYTGAIKDISAGKITFQHCLKILGPIIQSQSGRALFETYVILKSPPLVYDIWKFLILGEKFFKGLTLENISIRKALLDACLDFGLTHDESETVLRLYDPGHAKEDRLRYL